jgi:hypothetical protein
LNPRPERKQTSKAGANQSKKAIIATVALNKPNPGTPNDLSLPEIIEEGDATPATAAEVADAIADEAEGPLEIEEDPVATTRLLEGAREVASGAEEEAEGIERVE